MCTANGLNERFSGANAGTMFGEGSYFAEDAGKCDHYTRAADPSFKNSAEMHSLHDLLYESADEHPGDVCYILVCRAILGYALRTQKPCNHGQHGRGTAMDDGATDDNTVFATRRHKELKPLSGTEPPLHHHSLLVELGGQIYRYREFVIFHGEQIYPEYVVAYKRGRRPPPPKNEAATTHGNMMDPKQARLAEAKRLRDQKIAASKAAAKPKKKKK
jgi:hypothetical protein